MADTCSRYDTSRDRTGSRTLLPVHSDFRGMTPRRRALLLSRSQSRPFGRPRNNSNSDLGIARCVFYLFRTPFRVKGFWYLSLEILNIFRRRLASHDQIKFVDRGCLQFRMGSLRYIGFLKNATVEDARYSTSRNTFQPGTSRTCTFLQSDSKRSFCPVAFVNIDIYAIF